MKRADCGFRIADCGLTVLLLSASALAQPASAPLDPKQKPAGPTPNCTTAGCHAEQTKFPVLHGPVGAQQCGACHKPADEQKHTFALTRQKAELCTFCHDPFKGERVHDPVSKGDCVGCHNPHGGTTRQFLNTANIAESCAACHGNVTKGKPQIHGPVAAGACTACHSPHASSEKGLLRQKSTALCLECHASLEPRMASAVSVHEPAKTDCLRCHTPHSSDDRMQLVSETEALCMSCHEDIRNTVQHAKTAHGAVVEGRKCLNCHEPHATPHPRILRNNPMDICLDCHNKVIDTPKGKIADMAAVLATGKSVHGPIAQKNCAACHEIHGGNNFRLLTKEYPPEFYAPFKEQSYALCFSCHEKAIVLEPRTKALTGFRNGDLNLHYLHVNKDTKGRTCRACHETHASSHEKHIRDSVPFGNWNMPVGFQKTDTGGSCAPGCHVPYTYDRDKPAEYAKPAKPATWPTESGAKP